jgi:hypothetical protein
MVATVYAQCLRQPAGTVSIVDEVIPLPSHAKFKGAAKCPTGTTLVGGGYYVEGPVGLLTIGPIGSPLTGYSEWSATVFWYYPTPSQSAQGHSAQVFAICYAQGQSAQAVKTYTERVNYNPGTMSTYNDAYQLDFDTACPPWTYYTAGGFSYYPTSGNPPSVPYTSGPNEAGSAWHTMFKGDVTQHYYPVVWCVGF